MKKQIPKGLSWQPREEEEDSADEPSQMRFRATGDAADSERPPRATTTRRRPDASRSLYSVHNPGHVDEICVPTGLAPMPRIPGKPRPRAHPQTPASPDPSMAWRPGPPAATPPPRAPVPDGRGGLEMPAEPPPPLKRQGGAAERRGVSGERSRPGAAYAPTEPAFAAVPEPPAPHGRVSGLANTLVGQAAPVGPDAPPAPHGAPDPGPALPPAEVAWKPAPPEPDAGPASSALPPWQPVHPQPPGERPTGTLMGFVPPRVSSRPPLAGPGGTLHGVEPPEPDRPTPAVLERPTPAVLERPGGALADGAMPPEPPPAAPRPARTPAGTVMGFAPPVAPGKRRDTDGEPDR